MTTLQDAVLRNAEGAGQEAAQPNVEDGFVMCRCIRPRKRHLDIRLSIFVKIPNLC